MFYYGRWTLGFELSNLYKDWNKVMHVIIPVLQSWRQEDSWNTQSIHSSLMNDPQIPRRDYLRQGSRHWETTSEVACKFSQAGSHVYTWTHNRTYGNTETHTHTQKKEYKYCLLVRILWHWTPFYCCWKCRNVQLLWILLKPFI